jgi:hypothetical protein
MKLGITGTRTGCNEYQTERLKEILQNAWLRRSVYGNTRPEFHHGDCIGVDVEAARIAKTIGYWVVCHPPIETSLRAYHDSDEIREPLTYFARNRKIVDECDTGLIVVPWQTSPQKSGGTWYTHDYALKMKRIVKIIYPSDSALDLLD